MHVANIISCKKLIISNMLSKLIFLQHIIELDAKIVYDSKTDKSRYYVR